MAHWTERFRDNRPWAVGSTWLMDGGDKTFDIVRIVGYLNEDDRVDDTLVIYQVEGYEPGFMFSEDVERAVALKFFIPIQGVLAVGERR